MTDPKAIPLLPCPFCGSPGRFEVMASHRSHVTCTNAFNCGAEGPYMDTEQQAVDAWNTRPKADGLRAGLPPRPWSMHVGEDYVAVYDAKDRVVFGGHQDPSEKVARKIVALVNAADNDARHGLELAAKWCDEWAAKNPGPVRAQAFAAAANAIRVALSAPASEGREVDTRLTKWFGDKGGGRIICGDKVLGRALTSEKIAEAHNSAIDVALRRISYLQRKCERAGASVRVETSEASASTPAATEPTAIDALEHGQYLIVRREPVAGLTVCLYDQRDGDDDDGPWDFHNSDADTLVCGWSGPIVARQLSQRGRE